MKRTSRNRELTRFIGFVEQNIRKQRQFFAEQQLVTDQKHQDLISTASISSDELIKLLTISSKINHAQNKS